MREFLKPSKEALFQDAILNMENVSVYFGSFCAIRDINMVIPPNKVTAIIGPSGCGKSTLLCALNRMNELRSANARTEGKVSYWGEDIYNKNIDPVALRARVGMIFQKPNPFPMPIEDNVLSGAKFKGFKGSKRARDELVEESLTQAALWDEVKDRLKKNAFELSGGQQQRLCIARALAVGPEVLLMDEPCSSLDPVATFKIEELMQELSIDHTIVVVTHSMWQAGRVSELGQTAFMTVDKPGEGGFIVEYGPTKEILENPKETRTADFVEGRKAG